MCLCIYVYKWSIACIKWLSYVRPSDAETDVDNAGGKAQALLTLCFTVLSFPFKSTEVSLNVVKTTWKIETMISDVISVYLFV